VVTAAIDIDRTVLGGLVQFGLTVAFLAFVWWLVRRRVKQMQQQWPGHQYTPDMVEPHRRITKALQQVPVGEWLMVPDGHVLRVTQLIQKPVGAYSIERLAPEALRLIPGEKTVHESFVVAMDKPPVWRRLRPAYGGEHGSVHTVDEDEVADQDLRRISLQAMVVDAADLLVLAGQLEGKAVPHDE
jgi:hypothetical protein